MRTIATIATFFWTGTMLFAQGPCDSVEIVSVNYNPFTDSLVQVHARNNSSELFDYPGFTLRNSLGDTIAMETVNFFGIPQESLHQLQVWPNPPVGQFLGTLELWTGFYDSLRCIFPGPLNLCPDSCSELLVGIANFGGALTMGSVNWSLLDSSQNVVGSGTWSFNDSTQAIYDTFCLYPGHYQLVLDTSIVNGGQPYGGVLVGPWTWSFGVQAFYYSDSGLALDFDFFEACNLVQGADKEPVISDDIRLTQDGRHLLIESNSNVPLGTIRVFDVLGRIVAATSTTQGKLSLQVPQGEVGVHFVSIRGEEILVVKKVFLP